ncbi:MAG: YihA family ribosome biogenesis GTP-binding protein [Acidobacteria bacterium]|nr:YihA family ribosome biogenesis GTP-binding protein [Acidobacteriota bacterium]
MMQMKTEFLASANQPASFPAESLPEVAFLGRSNVGKSSLINALTGQHRMAFTSSTPGRTQTINFYRVDGRLHLVDLPGYGYARVPREHLDGWKRLIESYLAHRPTLRLAILLLDARRGWMEKDRELRDWLTHHRIPIQVVVTKIDKLNRNEERLGMQAVAREIPEGSPIPFSALKGRGVRETWQAIWKTTKQT